MTDLNIDWENLKQQFGTAINISRITGINYQTVVYHFNKNGWALSERASKKRLAESISQDILEAKYAELQSSRLTGEFFGISESQVNHRLPKQLKAKNACVKAEVNEDFFKYDTEESMYVAGFLAADGCLFKKNGRYKQVSLGLHQKDAELVHMIANLLEFKGTIWSLIAKSNNPKWADSPKIGFCVSSDKLFDDLVSRFGLSERKSMTLKFPDRLVEHPLVNHFIRGYWDGDGTVGHYVGQRSLSPSCFCGIRGTPEFLMIVRKILERETSVKKRGDAPIRISSGQGVLEYGGNLIAASIRDFLYRNSSHFLKRKRDQFFADFVGRRAKYKPTFADTIKRSRPIEAFNPDTNERMLYVNMTELKKENRFSEWGVLRCLEGKKSLYAGFAFKRWEKGTFPSLTEKILRGATQFCPTNFST